MITHIKTARSGLPNPRLLLDLAIQPEQKAIVCTQSLSAVVLLTPACRSATAAERAYLTTFACTQAISYQTSKLDRANKQDRPEPVLGCSASEVHCATIVKLVGL